MWLNNGGEDAYFLYTSERAELFYNNKLVLSVTIPPFDSGKELPGGTWLTAGDDDQIFYLNDPGIVGGMVAEAARSGVCSCIHW
jgi:hypothetical protein